MNKNTISKKWLYFPIVSMVFSMLIGLFIFNSTLSDWLERKIEGSLSTEITRVIREIKEDNVSFSDLKSLDVYVKTSLELAKEDHITLIKADGTPIADTDISLSAVLQLENHLNRQEVVNAKDSGYGTSTRFSTSRFKNLLYSAKSFEYKGQTYILRAATPLTRIDAMVNELMNILIILMGINITLVIASSLLSNKLIQQQVKNEQDLQEERIEQRTQEVELLHRLAIKELSLGKLSVSIGISTYPTNGLQAEDLTKLADIALYEAKGKGRDQSCHYNELIQTNDIETIENPERNTNVVNLEG